jgi:hypothetical protein
MKTQRDVGTIVTICWVSLQSSPCPPSFHCYPEGKRWKLRLHEKGGKEHVVPVHHVLEEYLDAYLDITGIRFQPKGPLFRSFAIGVGRPLSNRSLAQSEAWRMIRRRAKAAGIKTKIGCHTFRATGITAYSENGGTLEHAQQIAAHESPRTTKLYDRSTTRSRTTRSSALPSNRPGAAGRCIRKALPSWRTLSPSLSSWGWPLYTALHAVTQWHMPARDVVVGTVRRGTLECWN